MSAMEMEVFASEHDMHVVKGELSVWTESQVAEAEAVIQRWFSEKDFTDLWSVSLACCAQKADLESIHACMLGFV